MRRVVLLAAVLVSLVPSSVAAAGNLAVNVCGSYSGDPGPLRSTAVPPLEALAGCGTGGFGLQLWFAGGSTTAGNNASAGWKTTAPPAITINQIHVVGALAENVGTGAGWWGEFYWNGGPGPSGRSNQIDSNNFSQTGCCSASFDNQTVGWFIACGSATCGRYANVQIYELELSATENRAPLISALGNNNLWFHHGWVRGAWPVSFVASDPSGVCSTEAVLGSQTLVGPGAARNEDAWHQCPDQDWMAQIDTAASRGSLGLGEGAMPLVLLATNAAGVSTGFTYLETVYADNQPPALSMSGPTDASATAGTQYITATATAGPSGVDGIDCSVDGSPYRFYAGASTQIAVQGVGVHQARCYAENNAVDSSGGRGTSAIQTWTLSIRQPSVSTVSFVRVADALRCAKARERVRIPARWVTASYHGRPVQIKLPAESRTVSVTHCHPRIVRRRVRVHGHWRTRRVVLLPRRVLETTKRVPHGASTTVSGWLGTSEGNALGGTQVRILIAPDDGSGVFTQTAVATTASDGTWTAPLPPGPSRIVTVAYDGASTVEPADSAPVRIMVPASVTMTLSPRHSHWGRRITISGQLRGGYVPPAGELVVLWIGWPGGSTEIGHLYTGRDGSFRSTYTFLRGNGVETYRLWASTATESDYPYAASSSPKMTVKVGP
jgi:hypothetical protein